MKVVKRYLFSYVVHCVLSIFVIYSQITLCTSIISAKIIYIKNKEHRKYQDLAHMSVIHQHG